jgi:23S rRNA pseudoU1915 N3-methylase RlmH
MKDKISEVERLRIENEMLKLQVQAAQSDSMCYLKTTSAELESKIALMRTVERQQDFLREIVFVNGGHLGINDFARNVYHLIYQN